MRRASGDPNPRVANVAVPRGLRISNSALWERSLSGRRVGGEQVAQLVVPEVRSGNAGGLEPELLPGLQMIDSAHDDSLNRVGHRETFECLVCIGESARTR